MQVSLEQSNRNELYPLCLPHRSLYEADSLNEYAMMAPVLTPMMMPAVMAPMMPMMAVPMMDMGMPLVGLEAVHEEEDGHQDNESTLVDENGNLVVPNENPMFGQFTPDGPQT